MFHIGHQSLLSSNPSFCASPPSSAFVHQSSSFLEAGIQTVKSQGERIRI